MMGDYMDADEVVIVTDVEGVMTGDPRVVEGARNVGKISVDELRSLSFRGAEVVAPSALSYKSEDLGVRVVHYQHGDLSRWHLNSGEVQNPSSCGTANRLRTVATALSEQPGHPRGPVRCYADEDINIEANSSGMDSLTFYVDEDDAEEAEALLHARIVDDETLSSVTVEDEIAVIRVTGGDPSQSALAHQVVARWPTPTSTSMT